MTESRGTGLAVERPQLNSPSAERKAVPGPSGQWDHKIANHVEGGIAEAQELLVRYGYIALLLAVLVEGFGVPAPGQTLLMAASIDAARGKLNVVWVLTFALAAAVLGNAIGYTIGRWGGHPLLKRLGVQEKRLARIEDRFARNGAGILLIARFFDGLRQLNGIVAGLLEMPWRRFAFWNLLGGIAWVGVWGLGIYFLGRRMAFLRSNFKRVEPLVVALTIAAVVALLIYLLAQRRNKKGAT
jgi:membrane protein DedA with SNARE-associated domain